jgi:transketolase
MMNGELKKAWAKNIPTFPADQTGMATRDASEKVMQAFSPNVPGFMGGSADLNDSTKTALINFGNFQSPATAVGDLQGEVGGGWNYAGRNVYFGVREHAMGAISNGLAAFDGIIPFTATFLIFSDYMRPPMRLAALMKRQVIYVFTHDSIALGEDGSTHQPVEQLANLRAVPHLTVIRPADANETAIAWQVAIETRHNPVALIFTRQKAPTLDRKHFKSAEGLRRGAYVLDDGPANGKPDIILIASGSEVSLIVAAKIKLQAKKISVRLVSMPSWELFEAQPQRYRDSVLPPLVTTRLAVEAGVSQGWHRYIGDKGEVISVEDFGASAPGPVVMQKYGLTEAHVVKRALALFKKSKRK